MIPAQSIATVMRILINNARYAFLAAAAIDARPAGRKELVLGGEVRGAEFAKKSFNFFQHLGKA